MANINDLLESTALTEEAKSRDPNPRGMSGISEAQRRTNCRVKGRVWFQDLNTIRSPNC